MGAHAGLHRARRPSAHAPRLLLPRAHRGLRPRARAPARAHAPRPEGGPAAPDARHAREHLARSSRSTPTPPDAAWDALAPATAAAAVGRGHRRRRHRPPPLARGRPAAIAAVQAATRDAELLIADGHHRYETMQAYAEEVGGEGEHRYILMCLVALEDPGLTVFPTHRLVRGLDDERRAGARAGARARLRDRRGRRSSRSRPSPARARCSSATSTGATSARCA